jgi:Ca2+-binding RTX toxin-like protein
MTRSWPVRRLGLVLLPLVGLITMPWAGAASGASNPTCFGRAATIVGSGVIVGTSGDDVIVGSAGADVINAGAGNYS